MTAVRITNRIGSNSFEPLLWLSENIGKSDLSRHFEDGGVTYYYGETWSARWVQLGSRWAMDVTFADPEHATFFILRWK